MSYPHITSFFAPVLRHWARQDSRSPLGVAVESGQVAAWSIWSMFPLLRPFFCQQRCPCSYFSSLVQPLPLNFSTFNVSYPEMVVSIVHNLFWSSQCCSQWFPNIISNCSEFIKVEFAPQPFSKICWDVLHVFQVVSILSRFFLQFSKLVSITGTLW